MPNAHIEPRPKGRPGSAIEETTWSKIMPTTCSQRSQASQEGSVVYFSQPRPRVLRERP